jgi:hypothetical protein
MTPAASETTQERSDRVCVGEAADVVTVDPVRSIAWLRFVESHPDATIFHHPAWLRLLERQYGFHIHALCVAREGCISSGVPFCELSGLRRRRPRLVCLPFSDFCGPLSSLPAEQRCLLDHLRAYAEPINATIEIRDTLREPGFRPGTALWSHVTNISCSPEELFIQLQKRVQRSIKKAREGGLHTAIRHDEEAMEIFYALHLKTRKRQGVPIQPRSYFSRLHAFIVQRRLGFVAVTGTEYRSMSAAVFCGFGKSLVYKYGASDPRYHDRGANHLMFWEAICEARKQGFSFLDFGRTDPSHDGLRAFKRGWHTLETVKTYSYMPNAPTSILFDVVNKRLVAPVIRRAPAFVCRVAGELLYRHFGTR